MNFKIWCKNPTTLPFKNRDLCKKQTTKNQAMNFKIWCEEPTTLPSQNWEVLTNKYQTRIELQNWVSTAYHSTLSARELTQKERFNQRMNFKIWCQEPTTLSSWNRNPLSRLWSIIGFWLVGLFPKATYNEFGHLVYTSQSIIQKCGQLGIKPIVLQWTHSRFFFVFKIPFHIFFLLCG
jgi:hypothetical protein